MVLDAQGQPTSANSMLAKKQVREQALEAFKTLAINPDTDLLMIDKLPEEITGAGIVIPDVPGRPPAFGSPKITVGKVLRAGKGKFDFNGVRIDNPYKEGDVVVCNVCNEITWCGTSFFQTTASACLGSIEIDFDALKEQFTAE